MSLTLEARSAPLPATRVRRATGRGAGPRSDGTGADRPSYRPYAVEVCDIADISPTFRRLTLAGPDLANVGAAMLDQRIKLILAEPVPALLTPDWFEAWRAQPRDQQGAMRTYTFSAVDHAAPSVCVDIACRPVHGPGSRFALTAQIGSRLVLVAPDSRCAASSVDGIAWHPGPADDVLLVGDETALPAIRNILRSLPETTTGRVLLDLPDVGDAGGLLAPRGVAVSIVTRERRAVGEALEGLLPGWLAKASVPPEAPGQAPELVWDEGFQESAGSFAWIAGEAGWVSNLRRRARGRTSPPASFMGYWRAGQAAEA